MAVSYDLWLPAGATSVTLRAAPVDPNGRVTAVWAQHNGVDANALIWAKRFE